MRKSFHQHLLEDFTFSEVQTSGQADIPSSYSLCIWKQETKENFTSCKPQLRGVHLLAVSGQSQTLKVGHTTYQWQKNLCYKGRAALSIGPLCLRGPGHPSPVSSSWFGDASRLTAVFLERHPLTAPTSKGGNRHLHEAQQAAPAHLGVCASDLSLALANRHKTQSLHKTPNSCEIT